MAGKSHMLHPYENLDLTFGQLRDIYQIASKGFPNIKITEKTDGQNIYISYDHNAREALATRNKEHQALGGLNKDTLKKYFTTDRIDAGKNPAPDNVVQAFYNAMANFEKIAHLLSPEFFFTPRGERLFYQAEVMDPVSENVIPYDTEVLLVHREGHERLVGGRLTSLSEDPEDYKGAKKLAEERSAVLEARLQDLQSESPDLPAVKVNAIVDFTDFIEKKEAYRNVINNLRAVQSEAGMPKTIGEYLENRSKQRLEGKLRQVIDPKTYPETYDQLVPALMHFATAGMPRKTIEIKNVLETLPEPVGEEKEPRRDLVNDFLRDRTALKAVKDYAMEPLIMVNHKFAVDILEGFISGYTLQAEDSLSKLRAKVGEKARDPEVLADEGSLAVLRTSLTKIHAGEPVADVLSDEAMQSALEKITTGIEGLVFDYEGKTYKFTGQFAPVNQMLGLGKFDRAPKKEAVAPPGNRDDEVPAIEPRFGEGRTIALVPGAFKPPHAGHFEMVEHYSNMVGPDGFVYILISPLSRGGGKEDEAEIGFSESKNIWDIYIQSAGLNNVVVYDKPSESNSPFDQVIEYIENKNDNLDFAQPGDEIILGCSDKPDKRGDPDYTRFGDPGSFQKYAREGVIIADHIAGCFRTSEGAISATDFRRALHSGDDIGTYIPAFVDQERIRTIFGPLKEQKKTFSLLYSLVEEMLNEADSEAQRKWACVQQGASRKKFKGKPSLTTDQAKEICKSKVEEEEELEEVSACGVAAGGIEGHAGPGRRKDKKKKKKQDSLIREVLNYLEKGGIMETQQ